MAEGTSISATGRRFVRAKLEEFERESNVGSGRHPELTAQNFTDSVDGLAERMKRPELRAHLLGQAEGTGLYLREENRSGRWSYDYRTQTLNYTETTSAARASSAQKYGASASREQDAPEHKRSR